MEHFIKNIEITNFKSIRHAEIKDCRRVNVFVGPPNVGKSNILEALSGFSCLSVSNTPNIKSLIRFKKTSDLFFTADTSVLTEIVIDDRLFLTYEPASISALDVSITSISRRQKNDLLYKPSITNYFSAKYEDSRFYTNSEVRLLKANLSLKKYKYSNQLNYYPSNDNTLVIPYGDNLKDIIENNQTLRKDIVTYLKAYNQKLLLDKAESEIRILWFLDDETVFSIPLELVADTLNRLIFYKAAILSNKNTTLLFEEPEAHCYEPYILEFTNSVKRDQNSNQFFIITHSQYVIEELLRDEESRNDTNIYLVGLNNHETQIKLLNQEMNKEIYQTGLNVFFNYESLWNETKEHEAVH